MCCPALAPLRAMGIGTVKSPGQKKQSPQSSRFLFPIRRSIMFEKTNRLAERLATSVSRRGFLGSAGRWAGAMALAMAGVLTTAGSAQADNGKTACYCCYVDGSCTLNDCVGG